MNHTRLACALLFAARNLAWLAAVSAWPAAGGVFAWRSKSCSP